MIAAENARQLVAQAVLLAVPILICAWLQAMGKEGWQWSEFLWGLVIGLQLSLSLPFVSWAFFSLTDASQLEGGMKLICHRLY